MLCNHLLFFFFFWSCKIKCLLLSDRGGQLVPPARSGKIVGLSTSWKILNYIFNPRNDCANCGRRNFCIQARQSVHQAISKYGRTGNSCGPVNSNIWLGNPLKDEGNWVAMILLHTRLVFPLGAQLGGKKELYK